MFCFQTDENRDEDDGNLSDDEADFIDEIDESDPKHNRPTLEEYVKKHVFKRSMWILKFYLWYNSYLSCKRIFQS